MGVTLANNVPTLTPVTDSVTTSETVFKSPEIAFTRLNLGAASEVKLTIMISPTFKEPNVLPAHVNSDMPPEAAPILTSSPSPSSFTTFGCNTKSPLKSTPDINVSS